MKYCASYIGDLFQLNLSLALPYDAAAMGNKDCDGMSILYQK